MVELTKEEKALIVQVLMQTQMLPTVWEAQVKPIVIKLQAPEPNPEQPTPTETT